MIDLWDMNRCAEFLGVSYDHFRKIRHQPIYPQPLDKPGQPRWDPEEWEEWSKSRRTSESRQSPEKNNEINA